MDNRRSFEPVKGMTGWKRRGLANKDGIAAEAGGWGADAAMDGAEGGKLGSDVVPVEAAAVSADDGTRARKRATGGRAAKRK
jgi:hypothetical protein